jgi:hypothetical protein
MNFSPVIDTDVCGKVSLLLDPLDSPPHLTQIVTFLVCDVPVQSTNPSVHTDVYTDKPHVDTSSGTRFGLLDTGNSWLDGNAAGDRKGRASVYAHILQRNRTSQRSGAVCLFFFAVHSTSDSQEV